MHLNPIDLGSLILNRIMPKERILNGAHKSMGAFLYRGLHQPSMEPMNPRPEWLRLHHDLSDLGSLILIQITPQKRKHSRRTIIATLVFVYGYLQKPFNGKNDTKVMQGKIDSLKNNDYHDSSTGYPSSSNGDSNRN